MIEDNLINSKGLGSAISNSLLDFILKSRVPFTNKKYQEIKTESAALIVLPLRIMSLLVAIFSIVAMIFEVRHFPEQSVNIFFIRLSSGLVSYLVLTILSSKYSVKSPSKGVLLVHVLLITIIISSGLMIYLLPTSLLVNASIVGLMIFTSALFLSWEVKQQIIVAIYYNVVFASAILLNDEAIYFLPNMLESVVFIMILSMVSIIACAINFRMRLMIAERNFEVELSEQKYKSIIDNSMEGIFQSTPDGRWLTLNKAFARILGYNDENELANVDVKNIFISHAERENLIAELKKNEKVENYRTRLKRKDGSIAVVKLNDRVISDEMGREFFEGSISDITEQVKAEEARKKVEEALKLEKEKSERLAKEAVKSSGMKTKFLANMSHEIRTPMNGILGFLTLIESEAYRSRDELKQFSSSAKQSAESLLEIINSILDLSKIEAGKITLEEVDFDLNFVIEQSISVLSPKASEKDITIIKELQPGTETKLIGDATKLRQIIINLLSNATKFTPVGEIKIKAGTVLSGDDSVELHLEVIDQGIGIPEEKINSLFKPFSQIDGSEAKQVGGTGLGLVICKEYVTLMDGEIGIKSRMNEGSNFYFKVKCRKQPVINNKEYNNNNAEKSMIAAEQSMRTIVSRKQDTAAGVLNISGRNGDSYKEIRNKYRVLLAEDNLINQKVSLKILSSAGYEVEAVSNGADAVEAVKKGKFDIVLMDIQMPEVDGYTATKQIREMNNPVPIIALTAHALMGDREKCIQAGMNEYISKPIIAKDLISMIDNLLDIYNKNSQESRQSEIKSETSNWSSAEGSVVFDYERLKNVSANDFDFEKDLIISYLTDTDQKLESLNELIGSENLEKIIELAHTLKGASYSIGASEVGNEAYAIELSAKSQDLISVKERMEKLQSAVSKTRLGLKEYLFQKNLVRT